MKKAVKKAVRKTGRPNSDTPKFRGGMLGSNRALKESLSKSSGAGYMWTVADGVTIVFRFLTEPEGWCEFYQHFDPTAKAYYTCVGRDAGCEYCEEGDRTTKRYLANVVDTAEQRVRALAIPASAAEILYKRLNNFKTLCDRNYEISRDGAGKDNTRYDVDYQPPRPMNTKKFELLDLEAIVAAQIPGAGSDDEEDDTDYDDGFLKDGKKAKKSRPTIADDDDDDDDDEEDRPRRVAKKTAGRTMKKDAAPKRRRFVR